MLRMTRAREICAAEGMLQSSYRVRRPDLLLARDAERLRRWHDRCRRARVSLVGVVERMKAYLLASISRRSVGQIVYI